MADSPVPTFRLDRLAKVDEQIRSIAERASRCGISGQYFDALKYINAKLSQDPLGWGDPAYRTRHEGGLVCHGIHAPLVVYYVVFEPEKVVCLMEIKPLAGSLLESEG